MIGDEPRRRLGLALLVAGLLLALALGIAGFGQSPSERPALPLAPSFSLPRLDGGVLNSKELAGRPLVINVWASWCPPCREEAPTLSRVSGELRGSDVVFLGVVSDDSVRRAQDFARRAGLGFVQLLDDGSFDAAYDVSVLPTTYVLNADGALTATQVGPITESRLRALIEDVLPAPGSP